MLGVSAGVLTNAWQVSADEAPSATSSRPVVVESVIYAFCSQPNTGNGPCPDGQNPNGVIQGSDGNFYGTTGPMFSGGGTMFKLTSCGTLTTLHQFCPQQDPNYGACPDGYGPGPVIEGDDGNFYGTTAAGGTNLDRSGLTTGTVFELTASGTLTTLYSFCAQLDPKTQICLDGENPSRIIEGRDGNFYGITYSGGPSAFGGAQSAGTVFMLTPSGMLTTLHSFCSQVINGDSCSDGEAPNSLIEGSDGNFYGTTSIGGQYGSNTRGGTVFEITPAGGFATLYSFCKQKDPFTLSCLDGTAPSGLIQGSDGNFYDTTC